MVNDYKPELVVVLENACLELVKVNSGREYQLLSLDRHKDKIFSSKRDPATVRPDIAHQCLLMLLDSPLNRLGRLRVYVRTNKNVVIEVNPKCRIPRTFDRFAGLIVQLLNKLSVSSADSKHEKLLKVIKNPIEMHFKPGSVVFGLSHSADEVIEPKQIYSKAMEEGLKGDIVLVIGAFAHGSVMETCSNFIHKSISISRLPLSGAQVCDRLCYSFEQEWKIEEEFLRNLDNKIL